MGGDCLAHVEGIGAKRAVLLTNLRDAERAKADVAARPEAFALAPAGMTAEVLHAAYLGTHMEYRLRCELGDLFVRSGEVSHPHLPGERVALALSGSGITVLRP